MNLQRIAGLAKSRRSPFAREGIFGGLPDASRRVLTGMPRRGLSGGRRESLSVAPVGAPVRANLRFVSRSALDCVIAVIR